MKKSLGIKNAKQAYELAVKTFYETQSFLQTQDRCAKEQLLHFGCTLQPPPTLESIWYDEEASMLKENAELVKVESESCVFYIYSR